MDDFPNPVYKNISLIRLYTQDNEYYKYLARNGRILPEAIAFFAAKGKDAKKLVGYASIVSPESRKCELLIDQYLKEPLTWLAKELARRQQVTKGREESGRKTVEEAIAQRAKLEEARRKKEEEEARKIEKRKKDFLKKQAKIRASHENAEASVLVKLFCNTLFDKYLLVTSLHWC